MSTITNFSTTDTWRTLFQRTNDIINLLNSGVVADGTNAYGTFVLGHNSNTSFDMIGALSVRINAVTVNTSFFVNGNTVISTNANVFNVASGLTLLQSPNGTLVNGSTLTVNSNTFFVAPVNVSNNITVNGSMTVSGNLTISNAEVIAGPLNIRQINYGQANAMLVPSTLNNPQYNDFAPAGIDEATVLNLNPGVNTVITGLQAPSGIVVGATIKYIQNINSNNKVTLVSSSNSSGSFNRFKTPNDAPLDILPGGSIMIIWTSSNKEWRIAGGGPSSSLLNTTLQGITNVAGNLVASGFATFISNTVFGNTFYVDTVNNRVGVKVANPTSPLSVNGNVAIVGTLLHTGDASISGNLTVTSNTFVSGTLFCSTVGNVATFANTISVTTTALSFIKNLKVNTFFSDVSITAANVTSTGKASMSGTLVIPVGPNRWAT